MYGEYLFFGNCQCIFAIVVYNVYCVQLVNRFSWCCLSENTDYHGKNFNAGYRG